MTHNKTPEGYQTWSCYKCGTYGPGTGADHWAKHPAWAAWLGKQIRRVGFWVVDLSRWVDGVTR